MVNRFRIGTRIGGGFALGLAILTILGVVAYRATTTLITNSERESHSYRVLGYLNELEAELANAETGQRGYLITGQPRYLEPYDTALKAIDANYEALRQLTIDNVDIQTRLASLKPVIEARLARLREGIQLRNTGGFPAAQKFILTDSGRQLMQQLRTQIAQVRVQEQDLLQARTAKAQLAAQQTVSTIVLGIPVSFIILSLVGWGLSRNISRPLRKLSDTAEQIAGGNLAIALSDTTAQDETGVLTRTFNQMVINLRETIEANENQRWLKSNLADLSQQLQGQRSLETLAELVLTSVAPLVDAQQGVFYLWDAASEPPRLKLLSSYAYQERKHLANEFRLGEGLVGQCALEKQRIVLTEVPGDYIRIRSGLGEALPLNIVVLPILFEKEIKGVLELASFQRFGELQLTFLEEASNVAGVMINAIAAYIQTQTLLEQSQLLTEELRHQQEELLQSNQLLEERTQSLQESELLLQQQQEELQQSNEELQQLNEELEEKAELLETQKQQVERKNQEIEQARQELEEQTRQLSQSSKYKSEFLANMSHELRTPLNSLLILAKMLSDNGDGNLTTKQVEYSRTIYSAGVDLLALINDILDMAKIESGTMQVSIESLALTAVQSELERTFQPLAFSKGLKFVVRLEDPLPKTISTDPRRLQQILKNLLSNAIKFTEQGSVIARIYQATNDQIAFAVSDTGIGIPPEKQQTIFGAFQQADGTTSRKYGGTGLGLSISLQLAQLLGGALEVQSQPGQGSIFTLYLPERYAAPSTDAEVLQVGVPADDRPSRPNQIHSFASVEQNSATTVAPPRLKHSLPPLPIGLEDDRHQLQANPSQPLDTTDRVLLVIEDDASFARILLDMARRQGFKVLIALRGQIGLELARQFVPNAITLDLHLPDMEGMAVLEQLKQDAATRHIPVHILTVDDQQQQEFQMGAIAHIQKPVSPEILTQTLISIKQFVERRVRHLLVVEDDPIQAQSIIELIGGGDITSTAVHTGTAALDMLRSQPCDCIVLDLGLPDMNGFELIEQIKQEPALSRLPIIVYTGKDLTEAEETQLRRLAETIIIKDVRSPERLLDETALFLHRVQSNLPLSQQQILEHLHSDPALAGKKVLIVDDDVRNIFALTSLLEQHEMEVLFAENGREGIKVLKANPDVGIVLMDVMMPELDGYETTRLIRKQEQFRSLPIIALTAKAMQGDREKCIEAGASDYITKPIDAEQLLTLLRLWLYQ
uniref:Circadian input-output histidine kinase CikA n=1 Tax=Oscillatoriales cyanobacterium SpSt-402 TaxID=2282168 RepID=A0A832M4H0_9CYAN